MTRETKSIAMLLFSDFPQTNLFYTLTENSNLEEEERVLNNIADGDGIKNALSRLTHSPGLNIRAIVSLTAGCQVPLFWAAGGQTPAQAGQL